MNLIEYLSYIYGYVKACKLKRDVIEYPYVMVLGNTLFCMDGLKSSLYVVELEYVSMYNIASTTNIIEGIIKGELDQNLIFNQHIYNMIYQTWSRISLIVNNEFRRLTSSQEAPELKSADNAYHNIYYYDDNPSEEFIHYDYYNMVPISKADSYYIDTTFDSFSNTNVIRYTIIKKKPKCTITIYRRALDLIGV